jgi:hypothetical protein
MAIHVYENWRAPLSSRDGALGGVLRLQQRKSTVGIASTPNGKSHGPLHVRRRGRVVRGETRCRSLVVSCVRSVNIRGCTALYDLRATNLGPSPSRATLAAAR